MTWVRLDDGFFHHPKVIAAGRDARDLYLAALCYCQAGLTDGFVDQGALRRLAAAAEVDEPTYLAEKLVAVGLWEAAPGGYRIHDYLAYNRSADEIKRERDENAKRQDEWRRRQQEKRDAACNAVSNGVTNGEHDASVTPAPLHVPLHVRNPYPNPGHDRTGDEDDAPAAPSAAASEPDSRRLVGDLLVGKPGFREAAEFWAALDGLDGRIPLRLEVLKALDWLRDKRKPKVTARFVLGWLQRAARDSLPVPSDADTGSAPPPPPVSGPQLGPRAEIGYPVSPVAAWPDGQPPEPKAAELWTATLGVLAGNMNRGNFATYFADTHGLALDNGHLVVGVKNPYLLETLGRQFGHLMRRTLEDIPGAPPDVRLVVGP